MRKTGKHIIFLVLFFFNVILSGQEYSSKLDGRVYSKDGDVAATHVSNITSGRGTITDANGYFTISIKLNDTLVFSAVQFKRKELVVTLQILENKKLEILLEEALTELSEVVVMPYNLSGKLNSDINTLKIGPVITASTENLPNANLIPITQTERKLFTATDWDCDCAGVKLDPLFNYFSGRTKMLNERIAIEERDDLIVEARKYYSDSLYIKDLKIPKKKIDDFVYFCETDTAFSGVIAFQDKLKLWEFIKEKSLIYRNNNKLD